MDCRYRAIRPSPTPSSTATATPTPSTTSTATASPTPSTTASARPSNSPRPPDDRRRQMQNALDYIHLDTTCSYVEVRVPQPLPRWYSSQYNQYRSVTDGSLKWRSNEAHTELLDACVVKNSEQSFFNSEMQYSRSERRFRLAGEANPDRRWNGEQYEVQIGNESCTTT